MIKHQIISLHSKEGINSPNSCRVIIGKRIDNEDENITTKISKKKSPLYGL